MDKLELKFMADGLHNAIVELITHLDITDDIKHQLYLDEIDAIHRCKSVLVKISNLCT